MLDLMTSRSDFVEAARRFKEPILVLYGAATPRRSKAEMQALAALPNVRLSSCPVASWAFMRNFLMRSPRRKSFLDGRQALVSRLEVG